MKTLTQIARELREEFSKNEICESQCNVFETLVMRADKKYSSHYIYKVIKDHNL